MSEKHNDGGSAFPSVDLQFYGMTLRDYFAAKAMLGIMQRFEADVSKGPAAAYKTLAQSAYQISDAMLTERERKSE